MSSKLWRVYMNWSDLKILNSLDSNECEEGTNDCFDDSFCTDTVLGFKCRCPPGYLDRNGDGRNCVGKYIHQYD